MDGDGRAEGAPEASTSGGEPGHHEPFGELPAEVMELALKRLKPRARACAASTCRGWRQVLEPSTSAAWERVSSREVLEEYEGEVLSATLALSNMLTVNGGFVAELCFSGFSCPAPCMMAEIFRKRLVPNLVAADLSFSSAEGDSLYWMLMQCPKLAKVDVRGCNLCADTQWLYNLIYFIEKEWDVLEKRVEFAVRAVNLKGAFSKQQFHNSFLLILSSTCPRLRALQLGWVSEFPRAPAEGSPAAHDPRCFWPLRGLNNFPQPLTRLDLSGCLGVQDVNLKGIFAACPRLEHLSVGCCPGVSRASFSALATQSLHSLNVRACRQLADEDVLRVLRRNPNLVRLNVSCTQLTDAVLDALPHLCRHLQALDACCSPRLTSAGLLRAVKGLGHLADIGFSGFSDLTDEVFVELVRARGGLRHLGFGACPGLSDAALRCVAEACPTIEQLLMFDNPQFSLAALAGLVEACRHLSGLCPPRFTLPWDVRAGALDEPAMRAAAADPTNPEGPAIAALLAPLRRLGYRFEEW